MTDLDLEKWRAIATAMWDLAKHVDEVAEVLADLKQAVDMMAAQLQEMEDEAASA